MGFAGGNRVMAFAGALGSISGDRADVLIVGDLAQQLRQHDGITDISGRGGQPRELGLNDDSQG